VALTLLGNTAEAKRALNEAMTAVEDKFKASQTDRLNSFNRGLYYLASGDVTMAEEAYTEALRVADYGLIQGARKEVLVLSKLLPGIGPVQSILNALGVSREAAQPEL
jgi:tetratricopeptide (TPR) repeat protein